MNQDEGSKKYDLVERTFAFAKNVSLFCKKLVRTESNVVYMRQVIRASSSVGANYIEANESLGKRDFVMKMKTCRKEAKESAYWLRLIMETNGDEEREAAPSLIDEAIQLKKIFSSIVQNSS